MSTTITHPLSGEVFTFANGMIDTIKSSLSADIDQEQLPGTGPLSNQGIDIGGVGKTITITGRFVDTATSVTNVNDIRSMLIMKYWFESIPTGDQTPFTFSSYLDQYSALDFSETTFPMTDPVSGATITLQANFQSTTAYLLQFEADIAEGDVEKIGFSMTLWVAGI